MKLNYSMFEKLLEENGITAYRVSQDTGIGENTLSDWKRGRCKPKVDKLKTLADYFGVSINYFLEDMEEDKEGEIYMCDLRIFENEEFGKVRTELINNEPWFAGVDVARSLGYTKPSDAVSKHVDAEDKSTILVQWYLTPQNEELGTKVSKESVAQCQSRRLVFINESGLYSLIFASKLPNAKKFKRWVTSEVLPALRKTGQYKMNDGMEESVEKEPQKKELDYLKAAEVIAGCDKTRLNTVLDLVRKAGFEVEEPRTFIPNIPQPVEQFLKGKTVEDVLNYTTRDLYLEFSTDLPYEIKNEIREADLEVYINVILGTRTVYRVVHGSSSKVFVM